METPIAGHQVGQYVLEEKIGEGGMAEVWRARNVVLGNPVAIKFLAQGFAGKPDIEQRFLGEGKRQANLQHANIVSAFDFLYVDGRSFLVMKYIKGESLDQRLFKLQATMPLPAVISISKEVLSALDYAHTEGIVHRDIKPSNILLETSGRAYVMDFGIALFMREQRVTRAGTAIGTPHYMSPEQIVASKDLDHRSDIYSYGCVLYQMLTQVPPFDFKEGEGNTEYFVMEQHLRKPPRPLRELAPSVPEYIERVVMRCLEKKPDDRFQTCHDLIEALSQPQPPAQPPGAPLRPKTTMDMPAVGPGLGAANAGASGTVSPTAPPMAPRTTLNPVPGTIPPRTTMEPALHNVAAPQVNQQQAPVYQAPLVPAKSSSGGLLILGLAVVLGLAGAGGGYYYWSSHKTEPTKISPPPVVETQPVVEKKDTPTKEISSNTGTKGTTDTLPPVVEKPKKDTKKEVSRIDYPPPRPEPLPPDPTPPKPKVEIPVATTPTSGTLVCSGSSMGTSKHGKPGFLFTNVPRHIRFVNGDFTSRWAIERQKDSQDLLLIPLSPQMPISCAEPWVEVR